MESQVRDNLQIIGSQVREAEIDFNRQPSSVKLLAVSKRKSIAAIREAYINGQQLFGENYAQEMLEKAQALNDCEIEWHFIGPIQSNKTKLIAETARWVHSVDRLKIAKRLSQQRPAELGDLQVCLQVNVSGEETKSGVAPQDIAALIEAVSELPNIRLRGLMAIPAIEKDLSRQREVFQQVSETMRPYADDYQLDTLSMGMSGDMRGAIAEGATIVRIGTAIFGERE